MNRVRSLRSSPLLATVVGLGGLAFACSAPPGEITGASGQAVSYAPYPPTNVAGLGAADLENAYNVPTYLAANTTVAIVVPAGDDPNAEEDLAVYRAAYGLPACTSATGCFKKVTSAGATTGLPAASITSDTGVTTSIGLDMASAGCPSCKLLVVELTQGDASELLTAVATAKGLGASAVVSLATWSTALDALPTNDGALASGVTVFAPVGQALYAQQNGTTITSLLEYPAASPNVIAVGETSLTMPAAAYELPTESALASGGSACTSFAKPTWQTDNGCPERTINDVAATGGPAWTFNTFQATVAPGLPTAGWSVQGDTAYTRYGGDVAASLVAAIFAQTGNGAAGPKYPYAHTTYFNDVTSGSIVTNGATCAGEVCNAGAGYDGPTGVGTPDGMDMALVNRDLLDLSTSSIDPLNPFLGAQGTVAIAVSPGLKSAMYAVQTSTPWASGCALTVSYSGLPAGVSGANVAADGPPEEPGMAFELSATSGATIGTQSTMTIAATGCGVTHYTQAEVVVQACVSTTTCASADAVCGSIVDNCGRSVECGTCATGDVCNSVTNHCCASTDPTCGITLPSPGPTPPVKLPCGGAGEPKCK